MSLSHRKLCLRYSSVMFEKWGECSVREMRRHLISRTEHLNTLGITSHGTHSFHVKPITPGYPIPKISTHLIIFWRGTCEKNWQTREDIIRKRIRRTPQEMLNRAVNNFNVGVAAVLSYSSTVHGTNIVLITEKVY